MGRLTEYFDFINTKEIRTEEERDFLYSHLTITDKIKKLRRKNLNRKGRRSTILTGTGLTEIEDENIDQKTLLGGD